MATNRRTPQRTSRRTSADLTIPAGASSFMAEALLAAQEELAQLDD